MVSSKNESSLLVQYPEHNNRGSMLFWNDYEEISPYNGENSVFHDGWNQRRLIFDMPQFS